MMSQQLSVSVGSEFHKYSSPLAQHRESRADLAVCRLVPTERKLARSSVLFHDGDPINFIYEVAEGTIKTSKLLVDGRRQIIEFLGAGDIIGLPFEEHAHFCAEAVTPVTILCYPRSQVEDAMTRSPALARQLMKLFNAGNERRLDHVMSLGRKHPVERVASFLLRWPISTSAGTCGARTLNLPMSRIDIADYLGLTQETVCRVLSKFKTSGLIEARQGRDVTITDLQSLESVAEAGMMN